ncbi:MAG: 4Fe-4S dicluster domain-containing protein, partial [Pseudomonadota bacterium]
CKLCSWACPYGAREYDPHAGVMKKCTLCVDRIYNDNLPQSMRVPACVSTCPVGARSFGDLGDPTSDVSQLVAQRGGVELMPEMDCKPVNRYLPPRERKATRALPQHENAVAQDAMSVHEIENLLLRWADKIMMQIKP